MIHTLYVVLANARGLWANLRRSQNAMPIRQFPVLCQPALVVCYVDFALPFRVDPQLAAHSMRIFELNSHLANWDRFRQIAELPREPSRLCPPLWLRWPVETTIPRLAAALTTIQDHPGR